MGTRIGPRTVKFTNPPNMMAAFSVAGKKENEGPYGACFDMTFDDEHWGEKTYEQAERKLFLRAVESVIERAALKPDDISYLYGGDLLNQIIAAGFAAREVGIPFIGLYGACSTMAESLMVGSMAVDGGFAQYTVCATSSHFATAERQFRSPLELGTPKTPTAQNTASASGAVLLTSNRGRYPAVTHATTGRVIDMGITDVNNMGAAMAPAAIETILCHLEETGRGDDYYDVIATGDLGTFGTSLFHKLASDAGHDFSTVHQDCGVMIYGGDEKMHCGGSGCGCGASMLCGHYYKELEQERISRLLFVATGALHSPTSFLQGESIPSIAHAISIEMGYGG